MVVTYVIAACKQKHVCIDCTIALFTCICRDQSDEHLPNAVWCHEPFIEANKDAENPKDLED